MVCCKLKIMKNALSMKKQRAIHLLQIMLLGWVCFTFTCFQGPAVTSGRRRMLINSTKRVAATSTTESSACIVPEPICAMKQDKAHLWYHIRRYGYTINIPRACKTDKGRLFLLVFVISDPNDFKGRALFRRFCGNIKEFEKKEIKTFFFVGQAITGTETRGHYNITDESKMFGDIIQADFIDSYQNITLKTILAFRWITQFCPSAQYILRCGHDVFINYEEVVKYLCNISATGLTSKLFTGDRHSALSRVWRNPDSKYHQTLEQYSAERFPAFISGWASIFTFDVVYLLHWASSGKHLFIEDVFMSTIAQEHNITLLHNRHFLQWSERWPKATGELVRRLKCRLRRALSIHGAPQNQDFWRFLNNTVKRKDNVCK
ncbi:UDP-GalNAc:beta-1,3-N-acetylgalactosaminyltransferase 1-like [Lingula anatina]|uniref:Hexosyltransferase n=1 Tax=Lingula anatina TaxID=7574 RepID=A0A2R2MSD8_LINAN|nr:UDP-GalNAc:beta-1,3-N-acetylgalactosaminyltransferase 1-like [Lingula anatina]|eukprot:XP_023933048.1 UDP-GalNAc:beta-1,3-N-acetylgalactosaminyltransferase 1-like [Lingula anatina]